MWPLSLDLVSARSRVLELALSSSMIEYRSAVSCLTLCISVFVQCRGTWDSHRPPVTDNNRAGAIIAISKYLTDLLAFWRRALCTP